MVSKKPSIEYHGTWSKTRNSLYEKAELNPELESSDDEDDDSSFDEGPRRSMVPEHVRLTVNKYKETKNDSVDIITSSLSLQERLRQKELKKAKQTSLGRAIRKTTTWIKEAINAEPEYTSTDWDEDLLREQAIQNLKKKKVREFKESLARQSTVNPEMAKNKKQMLLAYQEAPLRLTVQDHKHIQKVVAIAKEGLHEDMEAEAQERRETKAAEKAAKPINRFSLAFTVLTQGSNKAAERVNSVSHATHPFAAGPLSATQKAPMASIPETITEPPVSTTTGSTQTLLSRSSTEGTCVSDTSEDIGRMSSDVKQVSFIGNISDHVGKTYRKTVIHYPDIIPSVSDETASDNSGSYVGSGKHESEGTDADVSSSVSETIELAEKVPIHVLDGESDSDERSKMSFGMQFPSIICVSESSDDLVSFESDSETVEFSAESDVESEVVVFTHDDDSKADSVGSMQCLSKLSLNLQSWFDEEWAMILHPETYLNHLATGDITVTSKNASETLAVSTPRSQVKSEIKEAGDVVVKSNPQQISLSEGLIFPNVSSGLLDSLLQSYKQKIKAKLTPRVKDKNSLNGSISGDSSGDDCPEKIVDRVLSESLTTIQLLDLDGPPDTDQISSGSDIY